MSDSAHELDRLRVADGSTPPLDYGALDKILKSVDEPESSTSYWQQVLEWLTQFFPETKPDSPEWLEPIVFWLLKNGDLFVYILLAIFVVLCVTLIYLIGSRVRGVTWSSRRKRGLLEDNFSLEPVNPLIDVTDLRGKARLIGLYKNFLFGLEYRGLVTGIEALTAREVFDRLTQGDNTQALVRKFSLFFPKMDRYLYGNDQQPDNEELLLLELSELSELVP